MARKKQEIQLQIEVETQEEWEEMLAKEGLTVCDVYQEWAGPCRAMVAQFRRVKNDLGDDLLHFSVAKSDTVDALEKYRGRCRPCFLFYAGGLLVATVKAANCPLLIKTIKEQLDQEHKVLEGQAERKEIRDPDLDASDSRDQAADDDEEDMDSDDKVLEQVSQHDIADVSPKLQQKFSKVENQVKKGVTVAIIKPDLVQAGKTDEVIEKMKEHGIEILEQTERTLTEEEAREFYGHKAEEPYFEDLIKFMSSGPSVVLVLTKGDTGENIIEEWRELLGPASVEEAKEQSPECLRAQYGTENYVNALHGSDSTDTAMKELAFFFPNFSAPVIPGAGGQQAKKQPTIQRTLALIRPDALREKKDEILAKIQEAGFTIAMQKEMQLSKEQAEEFYKEHQGQEYFDELTTRMSSGPLLALALAREDAVSGWRDLLGPKEVDKAKEEAPDSLRAQFSVEGVPINMLHGTDDEEKVNEEMKFYFGEVQQTIAVVKPDAITTKDEIMSRIREAGFHIAARKETELTKEIAQQFYKDHAEKEYYDDLTEHMASGPTLFMVLSREDAVDGWRSLIGPTDPEKAKEEAPETLRALYGKDIKMNAVHGASNPDHASEAIKLVFGDVEFTEDGGEEEQAQESQKAEAAEAGQEGEAQAEEAKTSEEQAAEGEQKAEGEQAAEQAAEGEQATEGEQAAEGETQQTEKEEAPSGEAEQQEAAPEGEQQAEQPAADGEQTTEEQQPAADGGEQAAAEGGEQQAESQEAPAEGGAEAEQQAEAAPEGGEQQKEEGGEAAEAEQAAEPAQEPAAEGEQKEEEKKTEEQ